MKTGLLTAALVAMCLWTATGFAADKQGPGPGGPGMGPGPDPVQAIMHELDLTDAQREKIETIVDNSQEQFDAAHRAVMKAHKALDKAVTGDANEAAIRAAATALGNAIGDEAVLKVKQIKEVKAVLTADQIKQFDALIKKMGNRPMPPRGQQGDKPGGPRPAHGDNAAEE